MLRVCVGGGGGGGGGGGAFSSHRHGEVHRPRLGFYWLLKHFD